MSELISTANLLLILTGAAVALYGYRKHRNPAPLPPGPRGLPFVGNIADLPKSTAWTTFSKWKDIYGGIVHIKVFGKSMIILNDSAAAIELLEKRGRMYSNRPTFVMAGDLVGWDQTTGLKHYDRNGPWSEGRRYLAHFLGSRGKVYDSFSGIMEKGARKFLKRMVDNPLDWSLNVRMYAASTGLLLAYGYAVEREDDKFLEIVEESMKGFSELTKGGAHLVDTIPILRYIPSWFPGGGWKRKVPAYRDSFNKMLDVPFDWSLKELNDGNRKVGFVHSALADNDSSTPEQLHQVKVSASDIYGGGSDTTVAGVRAFFLSMILNPFAQDKAQAEIDAVIGSERLPTFDDRPNLPYVEALYWEVLRCYPISPLALPHVVSEDDIYNGYFIPKGAAIVPNIWQFVKDPVTYMNPDKFLPERFLPSNGHIPEEDPRNYIYGFGRRLCPGKHLGDAVMWMAVVSVLATFKINPQIKNGKSVIPNPTFSDGTVLHFDAIECNVRPRSAAIERLILSN